MFYYILFDSVLLYSVLCCSILYSILFFSVLFCSVLFCSVLFSSIPFYCFHLQYGVLQEYFRSITAVLEEYFRSITEYYKEWQLAGSPGFPGLLFPSAAPGGSAARSPGVLEITSGSADFSHNPSLLTKRCDL